MKVHKGNRDGGYNQPPELPELNLPEVPRHKNKKDTKRWCLGKVGREHDIVRMPLMSSIFPDTFICWQDVCTKCKKTFWVRKKKKKSLTTK